MHGDDMSTTADGKDAYEEVKLAGRMKIVKRTEGISTTDLVGRLLLMTKQHHIVIPEPNMSPRSGGGVIVSTSPTSRVAGGSTVPGRKSSVPSFLLDHTPTSPSKPHTLTLTPSSQLRSLSITPITTTTVTPTNTTTPTVKADSAPSAVVPAAETAFASKGISNFLPTTWRIAQFSNNRTPQASDTVVYIDGAFDLFHVGHIETLKTAKAQGSFLYVGLHDDNTINAHRGKNYPIMNLHERCMNVLSCKYVDEVVIGAPWICTRDLITTLGVHVVVSGSNSKYEPVPRQGRRASGLLCRGESHGHIQRDRHELPAGDGGRGRAHSGEQVEVRKEEREAECERERLSDRTEAVRGGNIGTLVCRSQLCYALQVDTQCVGGGAVGWLRALVRCSRCGTLKIVVAVEDYR